MEKEGYFIDRETNQMYHNEVFVSSKTDANHFTLHVLEQMIFHGEVEELFICTNQTQQKSRLERLMVQDVTSEWHTKYKYNICLDDEAYLHDFPNGYCFFVELWGSDSGPTILVFFYSH